VTARAFRAEQGVALIMAAMATTLLLAVGASLILITSAETSIAGNARLSTESLYGAYAVVERTVAELTGIGDWTAVLNGAITSPFVDAAPGPRALGDGTTFDLREVLGLANCARRAGCSSTQMDAVTARRPWGANNPRWRLFAHGGLDDLAGGVVQGSPLYVVAMVGDDGGENDGDPLVDGGGAGPLPNPGRRVLLIRGEAFGPRGAHRVVEAVVAAYRMDELDPASPQRVHVRSWAVY
jgi:hypothetical protein